MDGLIWPVFGSEEKGAVVRVLNSGQLYAGEEVSKFEQEYKDYIGAEYAVAVGNATQGLHLALAALGIGKGDEVIVTGYSWISTASCIFMQNAVPIFCDVENETYGIDPQLIEAQISESTKAIILTHMFGYPARIEEVKAICRARELYLIEDN